MIKHEQAFTTRFKNWLEAKNLIKGDAVFEMKVALGHRFYFSAVQPHQLAGLKRVKHHRFVWKISDDSRGVKPFDVFSYDRADAFIVLAYKKGHRISNFWVIDVDKWEQIVRDSKRLSVTEAEIASQGDGVTEYFF